MPPLFEIALIEDDDIMGDALRERLEFEGYRVHWYQDLRSGIEGLSRHAFDALISDIRLPDGNGAELMALMEKQGAAIIPTIFITAFGTIDQAVGLVRDGAYDYLTKPLDMAKLLHRLAELKMRRQAIQSPSGGPVLGVSSSMARLATQVGRLIEHPEIPVLLVGESGVGKEVVARYLHNLQCPQAPFEALNCAAVPNTLIGSELFGYEKGAFTGATQRHAGLFERAGRGIAFLDEIGDMPVEIQPVLLRLLQERRFLRLGGGQENEIQCRIVFATHQELRQLVETGAFREDLYYRINVVQIVIPPLRERREDIVWLARKFVADFSQEHPDSPRFLSEVVCDYLTSCHWPGNVRELKNAVLRACVLNNREVLEIEDFAYPQSETGGAGMALQAQRQQSEKDHILATLRSHGLRVAETAQALGISRKTLWQKMKKYDIRREKLS